jgi:hypothetical protein
MKTTSQSSKVHLPKTDVAYLASLRRAAQLLHTDGERKRAWSYYAELCELINQGTLDALSTGNVAADELLMFGELSESFEQAQANQNRKTIRLKLSLLEGSSLTQDILKVLEKHMKGQEHGE